MTDNVNHPAHYIADNGMEAIDVIEAFFHGNAFLANVFKYIARAGKKGDAVVDLCKAQVYLQREIDRLWPPVTVDNDGPWVSLLHVPEGVSVYDCDGDKMSATSVRYEKESLDPNGHPYWDVYAPFVKATA